MEHGERADRSGRRHLISAGILCFGWAIALVVYITSAPTTEDFDVYDLEHSKKYLRQVEIIGGKAGLLANDLREWVAGLFHGQSLAYTIAVVTAVVALAAHLFQKRHTPASEQ